MLKSPTAFQERILAQAKLPPDQQPKQQQNIYMPLFLKIMSKST